jgi:hypothetical protein
MHFDECKEARFDFSARCLLSLTWCAVPSQDVGLTLSLVMEKSHDRPPAFTKYSDDVGC